MNTTAILGVFVPAFLALILALGGVFVFRGSYYKSLAGRVDELEERDQRNYLENQRLRQENETLRRLVTGEIALEQLVELARKHEDKANTRHAEIIGKEQRLIDLVIDLKRMVEHAK